MKFTVKRPQEIEIRYVDISFPVDDEDIEEDNLTALIDPATPFTLSFRVDIETGKIQDFRGDPDESYEIYVKVVDQGSYSLIGPTGSVIAEIEENYVPHCVVPGNYGDYIELDIDENGIITNWPKSPNVSEFFPEDKD